jgi:hypothetical protein
LSQRVERDERGEGRERGEKTVGEERRGERKRGKV